jgi:hypothetical protein
VSQENGAQQGGPATERRQAMADERIEGPGMQTEDDTEDSGIDPKTKTDRGLEDEE